MRRRIIALALAATLAVGGGAAYAWESRLTDEDVPFVGYPTAQEVSSWQLMRGQYERSAERGESVAPVFGSSELNRGRRAPLIRATCLLPVPTMWAR